MVDLYQETLDCSLSIARVLGRTIYLKGTKTIGWKLYDEPPQAPYFVMQTDGQAIEVKREDNEN